MPSINRNRPTTPTATTGTTGAGATTSTTATGTTTPAGAATPDAPIPSAAGTINAAVPKVPINGLNGLDARELSAAGSRFNVTTEFNNFHAEGEGAVSRGFIEVSADAIPGGARIHVNTFHKSKGDKLTLVLQAEVLDTKSNQLRTINLAVLAKQVVLNEGGYRGSASFDISYADVNAYLQARNPNLKLNPGTTSLAVAAKFNGSHQAGGPGRGGNFRTPLPAGAQSPTATRIGNVTGHTEQTDLPLDMQVAYPAELVKQFPMLKQGGSVVSRLESEFKGSSTQKDMASAVRKMYDLVGKAAGGDRSGITQLLGPDWNITTVNRYWLKDDGSANAPGQAGTGMFKGFRVDDEGLPIQDPMRDQYMDDAQLSMTKEEGAIRLRKNEQATFINVKPGGGRLDPRTGIRQRVEVGVELRADATQQDAAKYLKDVARNAKWSNTVFNHAERQVKKLDASMQLANTLQPFLDVTQDRHKFTVKNEKTGVEIELSFDFVTARTLRNEHGNLDGSPREVKYAVLEAELDHLQLQSANATDFQGSSAGFLAFKDDNSQDDWLKATSAQATMDIDPRLHELEDLENESFRSTGSYKAFEGANKKLLPFLFPAGLDPAKQKAAHGADLLSAVVKDAPAVVNKMAFLVGQYGIEWTPELEKLVKTKAEADGGVQSTNQILDKYRNNIDGLLQQLNDNQPVTGLRYDPAMIKSTVEASLTGLGLTMTPEIEAMLGQIDIAKLPPQQLRTLLNGVPQQDDKLAFTALANALGVSPVPAPGIDTQKLTQGLHGPMAAAWIDRGAFGDIQAFVDDAVQKGASAKKIRDALAVFANNPESALQRVAQAAPGTTPPVLHADKKRVIGEVAGKLSSHLVMVDSALEDFLKEAAKKVPRRDMHTFVSSLARADFKQQLDAFAAKQGLTAPPLQLDESAVKSRLQGAAGQVGVVVDDALTKFALDLLGNGAPVSKVEGFVASLWNQTPANAFSRQRVALPEGTQVPQISFEPGFVSNNLQNSTQNVPFNNHGEIAQFIVDLCKADPTLTPYNLTRAAGYFNRSKTLGEAFKRFVPAYKVPDGLTEPKVAWQPDQLISYWKTSSSYMRTMKPELEKYLEQALPKAIQNPEFVLYTIYNQTPQNVVKHVQAWSGDAPPAGVP